MSYENHVTSYGITWLWCGCDVHDVGAIRSDMNVIKVWYEKWHIKHIKVTVFCVGVIVCYMGVICLWCAWYGVIWCKIIWRRCGVGLLWAQCTWCKYNMISMWCDTKVMWRGRGVICVRYICDVNDVDGLCCDIKWKWCHVMSSWYGVICATLYCDFIAMWYKS